MCRRFNSCQHHKTKDQRNPLVFCLVVYVDTGELPRTPWPSGRRIAPPFRPAPDGAFPSYTTYSSSFEHGKGSFGVWTAENYRLRTEKAFLVLGRRRRMR